MSCCGRCQRNDQSMIEKQMMSCVVDLLSSIFGATSGISTGAGQGFQNFLMTFFSGRGNTLPTPMTTRR
jgi:hypothetical protein